MAEQCPTHTATEQQSLCAKWMPAQLQMQVAFELGKKLRKVIIPKNIPLFFPVLPGVHQAYEMYCALQDGTLYTRKSGSQ